MGMVRESPGLIAREISAVRQKRTNRAFGVNHPLGSHPPALLADEMAACFHAGVPAMCFFWGVDVACDRARPKRAGCLVLYQVGSVADAVKAERCGRRC